MKLYEFMTTKIEYIDSDKSVYDAIEKMVDRRIRSLVVRFPGKETESGVITARDVVFKALAMEIDPRILRVSEIAAKPLHCISHEADLREAAGIMETKNISRLFIRNGEEIIGVVSLIDLMSAALIRRARGNDVTRKK